MVDINPAALSRPSISLSTPVLSKQSINVSLPSLHKAPKTSQLIPSRIDLEPIYAALKASIGPEQWPTYKESFTNFMIGMAARIYHGPTYTCPPTNTNWAGIIHICPDADPPAQAVSIRPSSPSASSPYSRPPTV